MTERGAWLQKQADYFMAHNRLPSLILPGYPGFNGCQMLMVSDTSPGRFDFSAHFPDTTLVAFRNKPVPDKVTSDKKNRKGKKSGTQG